MKPERWPFVDLLRGMAIVWIAIFHLYVDTRGRAGSDAGAAAARAAWVRGDVLDLVGTGARALAGLPGFRLDIFLVITGLVLSLSATTGARAFVGRRLQAVLPGYWLGSVVGAGLLVLLAAFRGFVSGTPFLQEVHEGTRLAGRPYPFETTDVLVSLSLVGRLRDPRSMQVVLPSLWYIVLVVQVYLLFPFLRALRARVGDIRFLALCWAATWAARAMAFRLAPVGAFDAHAMVICFAPFRLGSVALGVVLATRAARVCAPPARPVAAALALPAALALLGAAWLGAVMDTPGTGAAVLGAALPLGLALPALWAIGGLAHYTPGAGPLLTWVGRRSLAFLIVQDYLRLAVGTLLAFRGGMADLTWILALPYLAVAVVVVRVWEPLQSGLGRRLWGGEGPGER